MTTPDQTADRTRDIPKLNGRDIYECANQLEGYVGPSTPDDLAKFLWREGEAAAALADEIVRLMEEIETLRQENDRNAEARDAAGYLGTVSDCIATLHDELKAAEAALSQAQEENAKLRVEAFNAGLKHVHETLPKPSLTGDDIIAMRDEQDAALSADMPAGGGEPVVSPAPAPDWESCG